MQLALVSFFDSAAVAIRRSVDCFDKMIFPNRWESRKLNPATAADNTRDAPFWVDFVIPIAVPVSVSKATLTLIANFITNSLPAAN